MEGYSRENSHDERLVTGYSGRLLVVLSAGYLAIQFGRNILPPLLPAIIDGLSISPFRAGLGLTVISATYALCMYPGGRLSDRLSRKTVLVGASAVVVVGFVALGYALTYSLFLLGAATLGIGAGLYWISLRALLADLFVERRGQAFGLQDSLGFAGPVLAAGGAVVILAIATWRAAFLPCAVVLVLVLGLSHWWIREPYVLSSVTLDVRSTGVRVFGTGEIRRIAVAYSLAIFALQGVIGFLPTFLRVEKGFSPTLASASFAALFVVAMVVMPIAGLLGDRIDPLRVAASGLATSALGLGCALAAPTAPLVGASILLFAVGLWSFPPVVQRYLMDQFPESSMGGDFGAFKTVYAGVGSIGPSYVGFLAGAEGYALAFLGLVGCLLASTAIVATLD